MISDLFKYAVMSTVTAIVLVLTAYYGPRYTADCSIIYSLLTFFCGSVAGMWLMLLMLKLTATPVGYSRVILLQGKMLDHGVIPAGTSGCLRRDFVEGGLLFEADSGQVVKVKPHEIARL